MARDWEFIDTQDTEFVDTQDAEFLGAGSSSSSSSSRSSSSSSSRSSSSSSRSSSSSSSSRSSSSSSSSSQASSSSSSKSSSSSSSSRSSSSSSSSSRSSSSSSSKSSSSSSSSRSSSSSSSSRSSSSSSSRSSSSSSSRSSSSSSSRSSSSSSSRSSSSSSSSRSSSSSSSKSSSSSSSRSSSSSSSVTPLSSSSSSKSSSSSSSSSKSSSSSSSSSSSKSSSSSSSRSSSSSSSSRSSSSSSSSRSSSSSSRSSSSSSRSSSSSSQSSSSSSSSSQSSSSSSRSSSSSSIGEVGIIAREDCRLSLVDNLAFCWLVGVDLAPYADGNHYIEVKDSSGNIAAGWIKTAGTGETLGSELISNGEFETDPTVEWTEGCSAVLDSIAGGLSDTNCLRITENGENYPYAVQVFGAPVGSLILFSVYVKNGNQSGYKAYAWLDATHQIPDSDYHVGTASWESVSGYGTTVAAWSQAVLLNHSALGSGGTFLFDNASIKQVTEPPVTGVHIVSTRGGTIYSWAAIDTAFDYNDPSGYTYEVYTAGEEGRVLQVIHSADDSIETKDIVLITGNRIIIEGEFDTVPSKDDKYIISTVEKVAETLRVMSITINDDETLSIKAIEHDANAYLDTGIITSTAEHHYLPVGTETAPDVTNLVLKELYNRAGFTISFRPPESTLAWDHADIYVATDNIHFFKIVSSYTGSDYQYTDVAVGATYYVRVYSVNKVGVRSNSYTSGSVTITGVNVGYPPSPSGLEIFGQGLDTEFGGRDCKFTWRKVSPTTGAGATPPEDEMGERVRYWSDIKDFKVEIWNTAGKRLREEYVTDTWFTYTYEKNSEDNNGVPIRTFTIKVYQRNNFNYISSYPATLTASNSLPSLSGYTPVVTGVIDGINIDWSSSAIRDIDLQSYYIYCDTNASPTTLVGVVSGDTKSFYVMNLTARTTYYAKVVPYDLFGVGTSSNINYATALAIPSVDLDIEIRESIGITDSNSTAASTLAKLIDRNKTSDGVAYDGTVEIDWIEYEFPVAYLIDRVIIYTSGAANVYISYYIDDTWYYLCGEADHTLDADDELIVAASQSAANTDYWTLTIGTNVAKFPAMVTAKKCRLYVKSSVTIYELSFVREVVADEIYAGSLSAITALLGAVEIDTAGHINTTGKDNFADTTDGIFLGYDTDGYKINIGSATEYFKYDTSGGVLISTSKANAITILNGGDINIGVGGDLLLASDSGSGDTHRGSIIWTVGDGKWIAAEGDYDNECLFIRPDTINTRILGFGLNYGEAATPFATIVGWAKDAIDFRAINDAAGAITSNYGRLVLDAGASVNTSYLSAQHDTNDYAKVTVYGADSESSVSLAINHGGTSQEIRLYHNGAQITLAPTNDKICNLAESSFAFNDAYADDWNNVADFAFLDDVDDVAIIRAIKRHPTNVSDRTGLPLVDDDTVDPIIFNKTGRGEIERSSEGKPWVTNNTMFGLLLGAIRQLDKRISALEA